MTPEQATGIALITAGFGTFGVLLRVRARRSVRKRPSPAGSLAPIKASPSPDGKRVAVVLAGAAFEDRLDRIVETGLWWLLWMLPARLCRIEVWVLDVPEGLRGSRSSLNELLARPPITKRVVWRGPGHPRIAGEVEIAWVGPEELAASFRGTSHRIGWGQAGD
jgi:hypothetical protein